MNYAYLRVSSARQGQDNKVSIPEQRAGIEARAKADGRVIDVWLTDSEKYRSEAGRLVEPSGTRLDRPGFVKLLAAIRTKQCTRLYGWAQDRLGRGGGPIALLRDLVEKAGCEVILVNGGWDMDTAELMGAVSGLELRTIQRRFAMGRAGRHKRGLHHARPPAGYTTIYNEHGESVGYRLVPQTRKLIRGIIKRYLAGESAYAISKDVPAPEGNDQYRPVSWVETLVKNPFYRGYVRLNGKSVKGKHEPAIDEQTALAVDAERARRKQWAASRPRVKIAEDGSPGGSAGNLFSGILRCGYCGSWMKVQNQSRHGRYWRGYSCGRRYFTKNHPPNTIMENVVVAQLRELLDSDPEKILALTGGAPIEPRIDTRLEELKHQEADLSQAQAALHGNIPALRALEVELSKVRAEIDLRSLPSVQQTYEFDQAAREKSFEKLLRGPWWTENRQKSKPLIRQAFREIWIKKGKIIAPVSTF